MQAKIVLSESLKPLSPGRLVELFFGMPLDELAREIRTNPNGKYDDLYIPREKKGA